MFKRSTNPLHTDPATTAQRLTPRGRSSTFTFMSGLAVGALTVGLLMPYVVGRDPRELAVSSSDGGDFDFTGEADASPLTGDGDGDGDVELPPEVEPVPSLGGKQAGPLTGPTGPLTASDRGVTATSIKLGVILPDLAELSALGVKVGGEDPQGKAQSAIDTINADGGILGRTIVPVFRKIDVVDQNRMRQGCLGLANDDEVFAVINVAGFYGQAVRCLTAETKTPFITVPASSMTDHRAAAGYLATLEPDATSLMANLAYGLGRAGLLDRKIAVVTQSGYDEGTRQGFIPVSAAQGADIVSVYTLANDLNTATTQVALAVAQFQRDGAEVVLLDIGGDIGATFLRTSEAQGATWDYEGGCCIANMDQAPDSFWGAHWISSSRAGEAAIELPAHPLDQACVDAYEGRPYADLTDLEDRNGGNYNITTAYCALVKVFSDAARAVGSDLTRSGLAQALSELPPTNYPHVLGPMSFRGGLNDGADFHRITMADEGCACFVPVTSGKPIPNTY